MSREGNKVFVGMPFGSDDDAKFKKRCDAVFKAIDAVCTDLDLEAERVDQYAGSGPIIPKIKKLIRNADYLVFDLTAERPNVYYEIGYAHGKDKTGDDIVLIAEAGTKTHFDVAHRSILFFSNTEELREELAAHLEAMMPGDDEE